MRRLTIVNHFHQLCFSRIKGLLCVSQVRVLLLTAVQNCGAGRPKIAALGGYNYGQRTPGNLPRVPPIAPLARIPSPDLKAPSPEPEYPHIPEWPSLGFPRPLPPEGLRSLPRPALASSGHSLAQEYHFLARIRQRGFWDPPRYLFTASLPSTLGD